MNKLWISVFRDDSGMVISAELVLVATIGVMGLVAGMTTIRDSVAGEFDQLGDSLRSINQSFSYSGFRGTKSFTAGSGFNEDGTEPVIEVQDLRSECVKRDQSGCDDQIISPIATRCESCQHSKSPCEGCQTRCESCGHHHSSEHGCCGGKVELRERLLPVPAAPHIVPKAPCCESGLPAPARVESIQPVVIQEDLPPHMIYNRRRYIAPSVRSTQPLEAPRSAVW